MTNLIRNAGKKIAGAAIGVGLLGSLMFGATAAPASAQVIYRTNYNTGSTSVDVPATILNTLPALINSGRSNYYYPSSNYYYGYPSNSYYYSTPRSYYYPGSYYYSTPTYSYPSRTYYYDYGY